MRNALECSIPQAAYHTILGVTSQIALLPAEGSFALIGQSYIPRLR